MANKIATLMLSLVLLCINYSTYAQNSNQFDDMVKGSYIPKDKWRNVVRVKFKIREGDNIYTAIDLAKKIIGAKDPDGFFNPYWVTEISEWSYKDNEAVVLGHWYSGEGFSYWDNWFQQAVSRLDKIPNFHAFEISRRDGNDYSSFTIKHTTYNNSETYSTQSKAYYSYETPYSWSTKMNGTYKSLYIILLKNGAKYNEPFARATKEDDHWHITISGIGQGGVFNLSYKDGLLYDSNAYKRLGQYNSVESATLYCIQYMINNLNR